VVFSLFPTLLLSYSLTFLLAFPLSLEANADQLVIESAAKSARGQWTNTDPTLLFLQIARGVMTARDRRIHELVNGSTLP